MKKFAIALLSASTILGSQAYAAEVDNTETASMATPQQATASYQCQGDKNLTVDYAINESGVPTQATFKADGSHHQLQLDSQQSDQGQIVYQSADGYQLSAKNPEIDGSDTTSINITGPNNQALYSDCQAPVKNS